LHGLLWIHAKGLRAGTSVRLHNVALRAPRNEGIRQDGSTRYALDLDGATISGNLKLHPDVRCEGGVRLQNVRLNGNLWADGLQISDGENAETRARLRAARWDLRLALDAQTAQIGGALVLRSYVTEADVKAQSEDASDGTNGELAHRGEVLGKIRMFGAKISGGIFLDGLVMGAIPIEGLATPENTYVDLSSAEIGGSFSMETVDLPVGQMRASVAGSVSLVGSTIRGEASIDADLTQLRMDGCVVGGNFKLRGLLNAIEAPHLSVGGDATLSPLLVAQHLVNLKRSTFGGVLDISRLNFKPDLPVSMRELRLRGISVARTLSVVPYPPVFVSAKKVELICWPGYSIVEVRVQKNWNSDADRDWWGGEDTAYTTFLCHEASHKAVVITGTTLYIRQGKILTPIQQLAGQPTARMNLDSDDTVHDYLRLFCSCLSDPTMEFFSIVERPEDLPLSLRSVEVGPLGPVERTERSDGKVWTAEGYLRHRGVVSKVKFCLRSNGLVTVKDEEVLGRQQVHESRHYDDYFRFGTDAERPNYGPLAKGTSLSRREFEGLIPNWRERLLVEDRFANTRIDLRDATCMTLEDDGGLAWEGAKLLLENFIYTRLLSPDAERNSTAMSGSRFRMRFLSLRPAEEYLQLRALARCVRIEIAPLQRDDPTMDRGILENALHEFGQWLTSPGETQIASLPRVHVTRLLETLAAKNESWTQFLQTFNNLTSANKPIQEPFQPQPYAQLAKVLRDQGEEESAHEVEKEKMRLEAELKIANDKRAFSAAQRKKYGGAAPFAAARRVLALGQSGGALLRSRTWNQAYGSGFGYGLSLGRAATTVVSFWLLGWLAVALINKTGYLVASSSTVASVIAHTGEGDIPVLLKSSELPSSFGYVDELACGGKVNQLLYAIETFTPLLNLRQDTRCEIRSPHTKDKVPLFARVLEFGKFVYELLGYVVTSLAVLTFSGIARRWDQG